MAFTVANAYDAIRRRLQDYSDKSYSDAELLLYINDAQKDFAVTGCCQAKTTKSLSAASSLANSTTVSGTNAQEILEILRVDAGSEPLGMATVYEELAWPVSGNTDTPTGWLRWNETVYIDSAYTGNLNVWYTFIPKELVDGNNLTVPSQWFPAIVNYAIYRCLDSSQDPQAAQLMAEYVIQKTQASIMYAVREDKPRPAAN